MTLETNRDLYRFVASLAKQHADESLELQRYLENLRALCRPLGAREALGVDEFAHLLRDAFETQPEVALPDAACPGFRAWEEQLAAHIDDLKGLRESGALFDPQRFWGIDAPSGARWYNLDPSHFLECGIEGTFGGWEDGDDTGRSYVPGPVATLDASGALTAREPSAPGPPPTELPPLTWERLVDFLIAGQEYE